MTTQMTTDLIRVSSKFKKEVVNYIKAKYYLAGKKPPSDRQISEMIVTDPRIMRIIKNEFSNVQ